MGAITDHVAHADVVLVGELLYQMVIVGGEESSAIDLLRQLFHNTVGNGRAVEGGSSLKHKH